MNNLTLDLLKKTRKRSTKSNPKPVEGNNKIRAEFNRDQKDNIKY